MSGSSEISLVSSLHRASTDALIIYHSKSNVLWILFITLTKTLEYAVGEIQLLTALFSTHRFFISIFLP